jgi:TonB family protein
MAAGARGWDRPSRRRGLRYCVRAPLDVTVLRSGIPDTLPGRSVNLGEGGVAAVVAGELSPGEAVGVEVRLPTANDPLRMRALVRHHDKLRSGLEFLGLSAEQLTAIRDWAGQAKAELEPDIRVVHFEGAAGKGSESGGSGEGLSGAPTPVARKRRGRLWVALLALFAILVAGLWWRWDHAWKVLESGLQVSEKTTEVTPPEAHVPAEVMEKLVTHRVDPDYPEAARPANLQGVIVLDVVVGRDGSVVDVRALNGPDILARAAMNAMRWWRFEPYRVDGKPAVVDTTVAVEFKP